MTNKLLPRHKVITDAYEAILRKIQESLKNSPEELTTYVSIMDIYASVADATGYSPEYCGDIIRLYLKKPND